MKYILRLFADFIFLIHLALVVIVLFGFLWPGFWYFYMGALVATLLSDLLLGYCILSKWEFDLRKKVNPGVMYDFAWTSYYVHKITDRYISNSFYYRASIIYLVLCIGVNVYFKFTT